MSKKFFGWSLILLSALSVLMFACSDNQNCDNVKSQGCDGTFLITGCTWGEMRGVDCKEELSSPTALCRESTDAFLGGYCYDPCTQEGEVVDTCIDHTNDTNYEEIMRCKSGNADECEPLEPELRPFSFIRKSCERNEEGILTWVNRSEKSCYRESRSVCCHEAGRQCQDGFDDTCHEATNELVSCKMYDFADFRVVLTPCDPDGTSGVNCSTQEGFSQCLSFIK